MLHKEESSNHDIVAPVVTNKRFVGLTDNVVHLTLFKKKRKEEKRKHWILYHLRKIMILIISLIVNNIFVYKIIGLLNKKYNFIKTTFVAYGASKEYALAYFYPWHMSLMKWQPWPVGVFKQNGQWGVMLGITSVEEDFLNDIKQNSSFNMRKLIAATERIKNALGADQMTFAGILPGLMMGNSLIKECPETQVTVRAVRLALGAVYAELGISQKMPVIVLGGNGHLGRRVVEDLRALGMSVHVIDIVGESQQDSTSNIWKELYGCNAVLINITRKAVLSEYVPLFWKELIILNETYPEPSNEEVDAIQKKGCIAYHVVGIKAKAYPRFPRAYSGGIPCCAAWNAPNMEANIRRLC